MCMYRIPVSLLLFLLASVLPSQEKPASTPVQAGVYMVAYRTPMHVRNSKPEVFHGLASDLLAYLKEKNVSIKADPERGSIETESPMSISSMLNITRQLDACCLLFVTVDRPMTKWIKVTVQSYNLDEKLLWSEEASDGGGVSGKRGYEKTFEKLKAALALRLGGPGLPVTVPAVSSPESSTETEKQ
jgi:hypothetical protein